ncbi:hypothetical protein SAMN05421734_1138 [Pelagirhabdus alkalitolerans]|uniref:CpXC protein n=1 Tax=Pelagirhabdus alkalitolerans TaxID=1612202 RepID=A0A1G6MY58_9BACI|nr:hypothetical protein [Pelagirhabdus alkalitolerans]SDC60473.1 hypothetical protein SAMN05421734_1138 [Pelagirhabdus alkalitolerans]
MKEDARLILGCRQCKDRYEITGGFIQMPSHIMFLTAYYNQHLDQLFHDDFYCPICENTFFITPMIYDYANTFDDKPYHTEIQEMYIRFVNEKFDVSVRVDKSPKQLEDEVHQKHGHKGGNDTLPTQEDIELMQRYAKDYRRFDWIVRLESSQLDQPMDQLMQHFN